MQSYAAQDSARILAFTMLKTHVLCLSASCIVLRRLVAIRDVAFHLITPVMSACAPSRVMAV
jgi:hypothetical protein